jgi:hypothetical protein
MTEYFSSLFRDEKEEGEMAVLGACREALSWIEQPYHRKFLAWVESEAMKSLEPTSDHMDLVKSVTRVNVFREIRRHLDELEARSKSALDAERE